MPRIPDASSVTRLRAIQPASVPDPTKRSASYVPSQTSLLSSLRTTTQGQSVYPGQSMLSTPVTCGYVNPRHQGYVPPRPAQTPVFLIDGGGFNFVSGGAAAVFEYYFGAGTPETGGPPASTFQVTLTNFVNLPSVVYVGLSDLTAPGRTLLGEVTMSITPTWTGSSFTSDANTPALTSATSAAFPTTAVVTVTGAPTTYTGIAIVLKGPAA